MTPPRADAAAPALRDPADVRSKTLATWIALAGGALGLHHFYLDGLRNRWGWLYPLPTLAGIAGVVRMRNLGVDDRLSWMLIPWLGLTISVGMLCAIVYGLTTDAKWARLHAGDPSKPPARATREQDEDAPPPGIVHTGWAPVLGVILALMLGGGVLMGTIAFTVEKAFDAQR